MVFNMAVDLVSVACVVGVAMAVLSNFIAGRAKRSFREQRSPVATFSMVFFAVLLFLTIRLRVGTVSMPAHPFVLIFRGTGSLIMLAGAAFNLWGRMSLRANWSDHVRVYEDHFLVTGGPYRFVRHPLYASLIWIFLGASVAYANWLAALGTLFVFVPAMMYRAGLEEKALADRFGGAYGKYAAITPRFFPRIRAARGGGDG